MNLYSVKAKEVRPAVWLRRGRRVDRRAVQLAIIGTLVVHALLIWMLFSMDSAYKPALTTQLGGSENEAFTIEMMPDLMPAEPPPPNRFVDINDVAPENEPDQTQNFAEQNQQLAQPDPVDQAGDMPSSEGRDDVESTSLVSGNMAERDMMVQAPQTPPEATEAEESTELEEVARMAQSVAGGAEETEGEDPDGFGTKLSQNPDAKTIGEKEIEGSIESTALEGAKQGGVLKIDPKRPQPRVRLDEVIQPPAILSERVTGSANLGVVAHNALRTEFGVYLARVIETVRIQWYKEVDTRRQRGFGHPLDGSKVKVTWMLHSDGRAEIKAVDGNGGQLWETVCVLGVTAPSPYGPWTDEMINVLGEQTEIGFTFFY